MSESLEDGTIRLAHTVPRKDCASIPQRGRHAVADSHSQKVIDHKRQCWLNEQEDLQISFLKTDCKALFLVLCYSGTPAQICTDPSTECESQIREPASRKPSARLEAALTY